MKTPSIRSRTTLFLCLTALVAFGEARISTPKKQAFKLILTPIQTATFAFYIIFGVTTVFQAFSAFFKSFSALRSIGGHAKVVEGVRDVTTGGLYPHLVFLGACSALVYDVLSTVWIVFAQNQFVRRVIPDAFLGGKFFVSEGADFFICFAMLALLYHRTHVAYGPEAPELRPYKYKIMLDAALLLAYIALIVVYAALRSVYSSTSAQSIWAAYNQLLTVNRAVIGLFCALVINIAVSSIWTWMKLKRISRPDASMLGQVVKFISPMLIFRAVFKIVEYVLTFSGKNPTADTLDSIRLARAITMGATYLIILLLAL